MNNKPKILFLYTEIAHYFLACVKELHKSADIAIVRWAVNSEAPFRFEFHPQWQVFERNQFVSKELIAFSEEYNPDIIICSGWVDEGYNAVAKHWMGKIPTILSLDNHYTGSIRQQIGRVLSNFKLHNRFSHAWVPGAPQQIFARKLGFKESQILTGFYSADVYHFKAIYDKTMEEKRKEFPHRFLYMGRYVDFKGVNILWDAFIEANDQVPEAKKWELWCVGTGELWESRKQDEHIKHFGFVQPKELEAIVKNTGVFVLPSHKEPWGVVVHEMAVAGFPLICSDKVGACSTFLDENLNGIYFKSGNKDALKTALLKIMNSNDQTLIKMGEESHEKGLELSPKEWAETLLTVLDK
jgi:glycosyltransferase involved in cell wall biosynthesis